MRDVMTGHWLLVLALGLLTAAEDDAVDKAKAKDLAVKRAKE